MVVDGLGGKMLAALAQHQKSKNTAGNSCDDKKVMQVSDHDFFSSANTGGKIHLRNHPKNEPGPSIVRDT